MSSLHRENHCDRKGVFPFGRRYSSRKSDEIRPTKTGCNMEQGGVGAHLLLGMAWASAFPVIEQSQPGSFHFVTASRDLDQRIARLTFFSLRTPTAVGDGVNPVSSIAW